MIEWGHKKAYEKAAQKAWEAARSNNLQAAEEAEAQMRAVREIEVVSKQIFARHNVQDIQLEESEVVTLEQNNYVSTSPEQHMTSNMESGFLEEQAEIELQSLPYGSLLRRLRLVSGLSQMKLAENSDLTDSYLSKVERGKYRAPKISTTNQIIRGFGWEPDDPRAQLLLQKNLQERGISKPS